MTIKPEHDEHLKASIEAAAKNMPEYKPEKYSRKDDLIRDIALAVCNAENSQPRTLSMEGLTKVIGAVVEDWAVHPIPISEPNADASAKVDAIFRELHDAVIEQHEDFDNETVRMAKELCRLANRNVMLDDGPDNPNINQVIMGEENLTVPIAGKSKRLACLVYPLRPLWAHYIRDAMDALAAMEKIKEENKK